MPLANTDCGPAAGIYAITGPRWASLLRPWHPWKFRESGRCPDVPLRVRRPNTTSVDCGHCASVEVEHFVVGRPIVRANRADADQWPDLSRLASTGARHRYYRQQMQAWMVAAPLLGALGGKPVLVSTMPISTSHGAAAHYNRNSCWNFRL